MCTSCNCTDPKDEVVRGCAPNGALQLWVLEFEVEKHGKGCAMCKASSSHEAEVLLKRNGIYNGTPWLYKVTRIEQIIVPPCNDLMAEQVVTFEEVCPGG